MNCTWFQCPNPGQHRRTPIVNLCENHNRQFDKAWTTQDIQEALICAQAKQEADEVIAKAMRR